MNQTERKQMLISLFSLLLIFIINVAGLYREGYIYQHYWISQTEHFVGGFFGAMLMNSLKFSRKFIFIGVFLGGIFWEISEYAVVFFPILQEILREVLLISRFFVYWQDTCLDLFLNSLGTIFYISIIKKGQ